MAKFEYKIEQQETRIGEVFQNKLNIEGQEGWELVQVEKMNTVMVQGRDQLNKEVTYIKLYWKRQL